MKVVIAYPPLPDSRGVPLLSQNRQFQWFNKPTFIYPVVPAYAATLLQQHGHQVYWEDAIAQGDSPARFFDNLTFFHKPDIIAIEAKTPIIKRYWQWIDRIKSYLPDCYIVLMGDHVTALPEESLEKCNVDCVLTGGDFDFGLLHLIEFFERTGTFPRFWNEPTTNDLKLLPMIDRELTKWRLYSKANGNFKYTPGTYTMVGRDCWWGKCTFCSWTTTFKNFRCRTPAQHLDEIGELIRLGVKEVFDDTGTFPVGKWLKEFCVEFAQRGFVGKITLGCNMIPGVLSQEEYDLMGRIGFRFMLFGLESANQYTLERLDKLGKSADIENSMRMAKKAGLMPHVTCMVGYPWETKEEAQQTINLTKKLFSKGYIDTLQATICMPYPGTPLFKECKESGLLRTSDWDDYGMRQPVMKCPIPDKELLAMTRGIYNSFLTPKFIWKQLTSIRSLQDVKYLIEGAFRVLGHLKDFTLQRSKS